MLGDARLTLAESPDTYDLIILDAFSSDAIPIHLMTREAMAIYCRETRAARHRADARLEPAYGAGVRGRRHRARERPDEPRQQPRRQRRRGRRQLPVFTSTVVISAREDEDFDTLGEDADWGRQPPDRPADMDRRLFQCGRRHHPAVQKGARDGPNRPSRARARVGARARRRPSRRRRQSRRRSRSRNREHAMPSERFDFPECAGEKLSALLDRPAGKPRAYALFAHCFTCGKDVLAAKRIAEGLDGARHRGAALRFHRARRERRRVRQHQFLLQRRGSGRGREPPAHDASGARDPDRAQPRRRGRAGGGRRDPGGAGGRDDRGAGRSRRMSPGCSGSTSTTSSAQGEVEVALAGRPFRISREFLDDVAEQKLTERLAKLRKALLVLHSPTDDPVGIENASAIFIAAKHPKSFVSLDGADHLLSRARDAAYVADVIAAWAERYLDMVPRAGHGPHRGRAGRRRRATASSSRRSSRARIAISPTSRSRSAATAPARARMNICSPASAPAPR